MPIAGSEPGPQPDARNRLEPAREPSGRLIRRFALPLALLSLGLLLATGLVEGYLAYRQTLALLARQQAVQAEAARAEIEQYLQTLETAVSQVQRLPWGRPGFQASERRIELQRLLALHPAILELRDLDAQGQIRLRVSRTELDVWQGARYSAQDEAPPASPAWFEEPFFDTEGVPNVAFHLAGPDASGGSTRALIHLGFLTQMSSGLRFAGQGQIQVVDQSLRLLAHPDPTLVLRQPRLESWEPLRQLQASPQGRQALQGLNLEQKPALISAQPLARPPWLILVEQPTSVALAPAWDTLQRLLLLLALGALLALAVARWAARRMASPIAQLRAATAQLAQGDFDVQLPPPGPDEVGALAADFGLMASQLQRSYAELEQRVQQRTLELQQKRDEAERANSAKTRFLATASHDLRQPMHAIGLLVGVLRAELPAGPMQGLGGRIHQAVQAMESMFGSLLDISKLDAGAVQVQQEEFALQALWQRLDATLAPLAAAKGLNWTLRPSPHWLRSDPVLLERILANLCSNAIRYTDQGGVLVAARPWQGGLRLQVIDSGRGIAAADRERAFDEFVRLEPQGGSEGLGLGLAIVRRSAELLGMRVQLRSRPGRGSCFELQVPAAACLAARPEPATDAQPAGGLSGSFVLVLDDEAANREALAALLQQWGCLVAQAADADAALLELDRHLRTPDLLVTDLRLGPGPDGLQALQALRERCGGSLPALLLTAELVSSQALPAQVLLLHKPAGPQRLRAALLALLAPQD